MSAINDLVVKTVTETVPGILPELWKSGTYKKYTGTAWDDVEKASVETYASTENLNFLQVDDTIRQELEGTGTVITRRVREYFTEVAGLPDGVTPASAMKDRITIDGVDMRIIRLEPILSGLYSIEVEL